MDNNNTEQVNSDEFPIYTKNALPANAQVLMLVEEPDYDGEGKITAAYRLPINRVAGAGAINNNAYSLAAPNADDVANAINGVLPSYVEQFDPNSVKPARGNAAVTRAQFLVLGKDPLIDGSLLVQAEGFYTFPESHDYVPGARYYLSVDTPGAVTTAAPTGAQRLFTAIDHRTIHISIGA